MSVNTLLIKSELVGSSEPASLLWKNSTAFILLELEALRRECNHRLHALLLRLPELQILRCSRQGAKLRRYRKSNMNNYGTPVKGDDRRALNIKQDHSNDRQPGRAIPGYNDFYCRTLARPVPKMRRSYTGSKHRRAPPSRRRRVFKHPGGKLPGRSGATGDLT